MTAWEYEVKALWQAVRIFASDSLASVGISFLTCAMHLGNSGGSVGTITGEPGDCAASPLASTNIQCSTARLVIGLPATTAASVAGTVPALTDEGDDDEPQPATISAATTKKAQSAGMDLRDFIARRW